MPLLRTRTSSSVTRMKRMDLFCTSPASTAVYTSLNQRSVICHGPRSNRHAESVHRPRIQTQIPIPCTSYQLAITPRPKSHYDDFCRRTGDGDKLISEQGRRRRRRRRSSADARDLISLSPPGSSRYLLSDKPFDAAVSESDRPTMLSPVKPDTARHSISCDSSPSLKDSYSARSHDQVVVLRVSLHCKGCESKVRKHLSRMEGVKSFSVDFEKKKVTVKGELTPLSVLASVSRVKNAQLLWPSLTSNSSSSPSSSSWSSQN